MATSNPNYGKALSAYKKIDRIKSSAQNIQKARNMIGEQRARAIQENEKLTHEKNVLNNLKGLVSNVLPAALHEGNVISGKQAKIGGTILDALGSGAIEIGKGSVKNHAGLGQHGAREQYERANIDIAGDAASTYNFLDSFSKEKKSTDILSSVKEYVKRNPDASKHQILQFLDSDDVDFEEGKGYKVDEDDVENAMKEKEIFMKDSGYYKDENEDEEDSNSVIKDVFGLTEDQRESAYNDYMNSVFKKNKYIGDQ